MKTFAIYILSAFSLVWAQPQTEVQPSQPVSSPVLSVGDTTITLENSLALRDPFRQPKLKVASDVNEGGTIPELERFEVEQFKLIGVISGLKKNKALLTSPDGKMHIVSENMRLGNRHGLIRKIAPGTVLIEEKVVNLLGQEEKIQMSIQFKDKDKNKSKEKL